MAANSSDTSPSSRKPARPRPQLTIPQREKSDFDLTASGTFQQDDLVIGQDGLRLINEVQTPSHLAAPAGTRPRSRSFEGDSNVVESTMWEVKSLDDLQVQSFIGRGACGTVKRVLHKPTNTPLALKIIPLDVDEKVRKQILRELKTLYQTACPFIVPYHGAFYKDGAFYVVLELMDGGSLSDLVAHVQGVGMPERLISHIGLRIMKGLAYLNKQMHVIHRDIKPSNLLLSRSGNICISDLGLVGQLANSMENALSFVGTYKYMSPERIEGKAYSFACDVWSVGLTLLECALGMYPFQQENRARLEFFDVFHHIVKERPKPVPRDGRFSDAFCDFIDKCLEKDPALRPTAHQLLSHEFLMRAEEDKSFDIGASIRSILDSSGGGGGGSDD